MDHRDIDSQYWYSILNRGVGIQTSEFMDLTFQLSPTFDKD